MPKLPQPVPVATITDYSAIIFDEETFPISVVEEFKKYGSMPVWRSDSRGILLVWDIRLYFLLSNPSNFKDLKFRYYPDCGVNSKVLPTDTIEQHVVDACFYEFRKGYEIANTRKYYEEKLDDAIWPLTISDANIKKYTLRLAKEYVSRLKWLPWVFKSRNALALKMKNDFYRMGEIHGFFTMLDEIRTRHQWENPLKGISKKTKPPIPFEVIQYLRELLIKKRIINDKSENAKAGPIIKLILLKLSSKYGVTQSNALKQIALILNLRSEQLNYYKTSNTKAKLKQDEALVESFFISISSKM